MLEGTGGMRLQREVLRPDDCKPITFPRGNGGFSSGPDPVRCPHGQRPGGGPPWATPEGPAGVGTEGDVQAFALLGTGHPGETNRGVVPVDIHGLIHDRRFVVVKIEHGLDGRHSVFMNTVN